MEYRYILGRTNTSLEKLARARETNLYFSRPCNLIAT